MKREHETIKAISYDLMSFFLDHEIYHYAMEVDIADREARISLTADLEELPAGFNSLLRDLSLPRDEEVGDYYLGLLTSSDHQGRDYSLLGRLIDAANVEHEEGVLKLTLLRKLY